jgi:hypothetical protein
MTAHRIRVRAGERTVSTVTVDHSEIATLRRRFSRRSAAAGGLVALVLGGRFGGGRINQATAQEGTPEGGMTMEGVTLEPLAFGTAPVLPPAPALFQIARFRFAPGGHVSVPASDPGLVLIYVEAGTLTSTSNTPTRILRVTRLATPEAQPFEEVPAGTDFTAGPGDSFIGESTAGGEFRNDGTEETVLLIAGLQPDSGTAPTT